MKNWSVSVFTVISAAFLWAGASLADPSEAFDDLVKALRLSETAEGLSEEGITFGRDLGSQMLPDAGGAGWPGRLGRIYDPERMERLVNKRLRDEIAEENLPSLVAFFSSDLGQKIVGLELAARKAFIDPAVDEAARAQFEDLARDEAVIIDQINEMIEDSDLVTFNVIGILNSNLSLFRGLVDGRALEMTEEEILLDVWSQEEQARDDSRGWLQAFL